MPTPVDIEQALAAAGVDSQCPRCGSTSWLGSTEFASLRLSLHPGGEHSTDSLPAIAVVCQTCGYIALHSPMVLGLA